MPDPRLHPASEFCTLIGQRDFSLIAALVEGLRHSVLVQAFRSQLCPTSLYAVYREGGMTFDAILTLDPADRRARLDDVLSEFVKGELFYSTVVRPIKAEVERHFRRHLAH